MAKDEPKAVEPKTTVRMKFKGHFKGATKTVELPIPLISNSQKLDQVLTFTRTTTKGPAFCDVPMEWVGMLAAVGGNWRIDEKVTPELQAQIDAAREVCRAKMDTFALENELVEA